MVVVGWWAFSCEWSTPVNPEHSPAGPHKQMVEGIAGSRGLTVSAVRALVDRAPILALDAVPFEPYKSEVKSLFLSL